MKIYSNEQLKQFCDRAVTLKKTRIAAYAQRFLDEKKKKVLHIYGLRKTGRTTVLFQSVADRDALYIKAEHGEPETSADYAKIISNAEQHFIMIDDFDLINGREELFNTLYNEVCGGKRIAVATGLRSTFPSKKTELLCSTSLTWNEWEAIGGAGAEEYISELSEAFTDAESVLRGGGSDETAAALAKMFITAPAREWHGSGRKRYVCIPALARYFYGKCREDEILKVRIASILWHSRSSEENLYYFTVNGEELFAMTQENGRFVYVFGAGESSAKALGSEDVDDEFPDGEILGRIAVTEGGVYSCGEDEDAVKFVPVDMEKIFMNYSFR